MRGNALGRSKLFGQPLQRCVLLLCLGVCFGRGHNDVGELKRLAFGEDVAAEGGGV